MKTNLLKNWWLFLLNGLAALIFGGVALFYPEITVSVFLVVLALWALLIGVVQLISAFRLRHVVRHRWPFVVDGLLALLFGIIVLANPFRGAVALTTFIGVYSVVLGILFVIIALQMHTIRLVL